MFLDEELSYILSESKKKGRRKKVNIKVDHPGILEVPPGKKVDELPLKHFLKLVKKYGYAKVIRALNNLYVWNKRKNPKLAKWARDMEEKVRESVKGTKAALFETENEKVSKEDIKEDIIDDIKSLYNVVLDGISKEYEKSLELHSKLCEGGNEYCKVVAKSLSLIIKIFIYSYSKVPNVENSNISLAEFLFKNTKDILSENAKSIVMKINQTTNISVENIKGIVKNIFNSMKKEEYRDDLSNLHKLLIFSFYENTYYIYNPNVVEITKIITKIIRDNLNEYSEKFESIDERSRNVLILNLYTLIISGIFNLNDEILQKNVLVFIDSIQKFSQTSNKFEKEVKDVVINSEEKGIVNNKDETSMKDTISFIYKVSDKIHDVSDTIDFVDRTARDVKDVFSFAFDLLKGSGLFIASVLGPVVSFLSSKGGSVFGSAKKFFVTSSKKLLPFLKRLFFILESGSKKLKKKYRKKIRRIDLLAEFYFAI